MLSTKISIHATHTKRDDIPAQLNEKVHNFKLKNEIVNGDFSQGITGWGAIDSATNNLGKYTATQGQIKHASNSIISFPQLSGLNDKVYFRFTTKLNNFVFGAGSYIALRSTANSSGNILIRTDNLNQGDTIVLSGDKTINANDLSSTAIRIVIYSSASAVGADVSKFLASF